MGATGAIPVVSGFGHSRGADGVGKLILTLINGTVVRGLMGPLRHSRPIAGGGLCRVRPIAVATTRHHLPDTVIPVSKDASIYVWSRSVRRAGVNVTRRQKRRFGIASLVTGAA